MDETQIAEYLRTHPDFFEKYADLLAQVQLKSPYGPGVISLQTYQVALLRNQNKQFEQQLATLLHYGQENDAMMAQFVQLTTRLLAERAPDRVPHTLLKALRDIFGVSHVGLRLWNTVESSALAAFTGTPPPKLRRYADQLFKPVCGRADDIEALPWLRKNAWMHTGEEAASAVRSAALIALRHAVCDADADADADGHDIQMAPAFGVLILGSSDSTRFNAGMATDFLARIGALSSAALAHLLETAVSNPTPTIEEASR